MKYLIFQKCELLLVSLFSSPKTKRERKGKKTREQSTPFLLLLHLLLSVNEKRQRERERDALSCVFCVRVFVVVFLVVKRKRESFSGTKSMKTLNIPVFETFPKGSISSHIDHILLT